MFTGLGKLDDLLGDNFVGEIAALFKSERDAGQFMCDANDEFGVSIELLDAKVSSQIEVCQLAYRRAMRP
ncbi:MAG: hypothetical protein E6G74_19300 [Alphaproteobacteria bacterium]|nr:MAG: hypothetical protein E6G74_19300 [Alphaproteobacteria bacterium]TMJ98818.1 MAG: hypothetical protein E6G77_14045 [Alphaproteobacteria bacterium]